MWRARRRAVAPLRRTRSGMVHVGARTSGGPRCMVLSSAAGSDVAYRAAPVVEAIRRASRCTRCMSAEAILGERVVERR
eukprot:5813740-Pleurochrysis_carterae.AAC.1